MRLTLFRSAPLSPAVHYGSHSLNTMRAATLLLLLLVAFAAVADIQAQSCGINGLDFSSVRGRLQLATTRAGYGWDLISE